MVNLFAFLSIILLFIVIAECGATREPRNTEIHGTRSNKYFKFQPRKEDKKAVALFRTSIEDLLCASNTGKAIDLPMNPSETATEPSDYQDETLSIQDPDLLPAQSQRPTGPPNRLHGPPLPSTPYDDYAAVEGPSLNPSSGSDDSDEIDLNVNIVITNMPGDDSSDDSGDNSQGAESTYGYSIKTVTPQEIRTTKIKRPISTTTSKNPHKPIRPISKPVTVPPKSKPAKHVTFNKYPHNIKNINKNDYEEIDINVAVIVTEMPEDEDNENIMGDGVHYEYIDDGGLSDRGFGENMAARVTTNTILGLASFCSSFTLTNYFFY